MNTLPYTLSEYEADPSFQALSTDEKSAFYNNYDAERSSQATSEDDIASIHEERIARKKSALQTNYKAAYPEDTKIDPSKLEGSLLEMYEGFQSDYGEQQHNAKSKPESYRADDIETAGSALSYKPYKFNGISGFSVSYPDGSYELVPTITDKTQLTEFFKNQRADRFTGKREGWLDKLVGDNELTGIVNKMRNEESGLMAGVGEARKGWEGVKQGFTTQGIVEGREFIDKVTGQQEEFKRLMLEDSKIVASFPAEDPKAIEAKARFIQNEKAFKDLGGSAQSEKYIKDREASNNDRYKNLFDSMTKAQGIKGSSVMGDFQRYVQSLPKEQRGNNLKDFFWNNPKDILPYIGAVAASSAPDTIAGLSTAAVGTVVGGPIGGASLSGSYGMAREYSASLLQGIQERANEEQKALSPDLIEFYMNDTPFMDKIKNKAGTRAGVIGAADAVFGGVVGKIMNGVRGAFKKTVLTTALDAVTEMGGEGLAGVATGDFKMDEMLNEGFGTFGTALATAPYSVYKEKQQQKTDPTIAPTPEQKAEKPDDIKAQTEAAKEALKARVNQAVGKVADVGVELVKEASMDDDDSEEAKDASGVTVPVPDGFTQPLNPNKDVSGQKLRFDENGKAIDVTQLTEDESNLTTVNETKFKKGASILYDSSSIPKYEESTNSEVAGSKKGGTIIGLSDDGNPIMRSNSPIGPDVQLTDKSVTSKAQEDSLLKRSVVARFLDRNRKGSLSIDPSQAGKKKAADVFASNPLAGPMLDVLTSGMDAKLLEEALDSYGANEHQDQQGALMSVFGLTDNDSSRRILTNALGNYWETTNPHSKDASDGVRESYNLANRLNDVYKDLANVENIYEMNEDSVENINKDDLVFNLAPDSVVEDGSDTELYTTQGLSYVDAAESARRLTTALDQGSVVRAPDYSPALNDKFIEASALQRPGVLVTRLADMGTDPQEAAKRINELYPNGWVIKDATGHAGMSSTTERSTGKHFAGQYFSADQGQSGLGGIISGLQSYKNTYQNWYVESLAQLPKENIDSSKVTNQKFREHRVHLYVDSNGQAHVFRNLTFDKLDFTMENFDSRLAMSRPANPNSSIVKALQAYAQRSFTGRNEFKDTIFGVDISVQDDGKDTPFIFEANALTYGMSGWLGNPFAMSELMSVMTGRPSFMTGMYELAKTQLTAAQLTEVRADVNAGMPSEYFSDPEYYRALEQGVALWNKYIPIDSWYTAMQKLFSGTPMDFLRKLAAQIKAAFYHVVDPIFDKLARRGGGAKEFPAYHGTPHEIEGGFSLSRIGTGEGYQSYGWGLYFTDSKQVANYYRGNLSIDFYDGKNYNSDDPRHLAANYLSIHIKKENAVKSLEGRIEYIEDFGMSAMAAGFTDSNSQKLYLVTKKALELLLVDDIAIITNKGNIYTVDIVPDKKYFLDLDKPITEQTEHVQKVLLTMMKSAFDSPHSSFTGTQAYNALSSHFGSDKAASQWLAKNGIPGNKYLDGVSRGKDGGTYNYVVFDEKLIQIINNSEKGAYPKGATLRSPATANPVGAYRVDGIQKGFGGPTGDDWVPMYQNVTIIDPSHPYDGSTLTIPLNGKTQLTEGEIQFAVDAKRDQPTGIPATVRGPKMKSNDKNIDTFLLPDKNTKTLDIYLDKVLHHPAITNDQKAILEYINSKFSKEQLNDISVQAINKSNFYNSEIDKMVVGRYNSSLTTVVHEIIHAVTANYITRGQRNLATYFGLDSFNNNQALLAYLKATDPSERESLIKRGVPADFIDLATQYITFLGTVGITRQSILDGEDRVGGDKVSNYDKWEGKLPYAALNLHEFIAESMTRRSFQQNLSNLPAIITKAKSMLQDLWNVLGRVLGVPFNKSSLLRDVVTTFQKIVASPDNNPSKAKSDNSVYELQPDKYYFATSDTDLFVEDTTETNQETNTYSVNGIQFKKGEIANPEDMTRRMTEAHREVIENEAKEEIRATRFAKMKAENPELLSTIDYDSKDPNSFTKARESVTDKLAAAVEQEDANGKVETSDEAKKREQIELLERNKYIAARSLVNMIDKPGITLSISQIMVRGFEYIMNQSVDPDSLSINKLKYFNNAIESLADEGEAPVGMKHIIGKAFHEQQLNTLEYHKEYSALDFNRPLPDWFRKPFLGIGQGNNSSLIQHATEIAWIGMNENGVTYLQELMGTYKQNIELKEIEEETLNQEFYDHIDTQFPKRSFRAINAHRIGVVARLTQYDKKDPVDPLGQINKRVSQLTESLKLMNEHNARKHDITKSAIESLGPIDPRSFPDGAAFIADLESRLTPREKSTLDKMRDMGARYHPALKAIKAITRKAVLEDWANYVHDSSVTPKPESEVINMSNLDSITTVLADRKGIDPFTTYPELDVRAIMQTQNKAIAYEKHTGVERSILASALKKGSPLSRAIDGNKPGVRPVSDRLRELLVSYHNGMTGSQAQTNGLWSFADAAIGALAGSLIVGANSFAKNFVSSALSRSALTSIEAAHDMFVYDANQRVIDKFLKANVPTQARRVGHYDNMPGRDERWKISSQIKAMSDAKVGFMKMAMRIIPQVPEAIVRTYSDNVLSVLSNLSNARPEKYNASAIWTAAYIKYLKDAGIVTGASDFLASMPIDQSAIFKANEFTSRALGYAPDKASKGSFWNGSSRDKQVLARLFYMFSQQKVGLATEFQSNLLNAGVNFASGDVKEGSKYMAISMANLMNGMAFRYASIGLSSYMVWSGLDQYFDAGDDEERRKAIAEAQRKYTQASAMSNIRDGVTETAMNFLPVANSALVFENAVKMGLDMKNIILSPVKDNFATFQVHMKSDLQAEVKSIDGEIKKLNDDLKFAEKFGSDTMQLAQAIDKLEVQKSQLTEQIKFKYFPSQGYKAAFSILGAYGIAMEDSYKMMDAFTGDDVEDEDKVALEALAKNEFAYKDNLAGAFYGSEMLMGASNFARAFFPSEWVKKDYEKVPTDVFWKSRLKVFQNPAVVLERGRRDMAKQALKERKDAEREAKQFEARMIGGSK